MSGIVSKAAPVFRRSFKIPNADALRWFPGHMDKGKLKSKHINENKFMYWSLSEMQNPGTHFIIYLKENLFLRNEADGE